jgi:Rrf2 family protein
MQISARSDYAIRAALELADVAPTLVTTDVIATKLGLRPKYVELILKDLRHADLVRSQRGAGGGHTLARPATKISLGVIVRVIDGPFADVHGLRRNETGNAGVAQHLPQVWVAVRSSLRHVLDETTLQQLLTGRLPDHVTTQHTATD